jgi:hypothetical protein
MTVIRHPDGHLGPPVGEGNFAPVEVTGVRDDPEEALANVLVALEAQGIIIDSTEETAA